MYSELALKLYGMIKQGIIKSNAMFWRDFFDKEKINCFNIDLKFLKKELQEKDLSLVCVFDDEFPKIDLKLKHSDKPFLFAYKGNIDLLDEVNNNVAVIGVLKPTEDIEVREQKIVKELQYSQQHLIAFIQKKIKV